MAQPAIQTSFASGEWAPKLRSRVDIQKYRAGAALLRNFYVDYAGGGASTRPGTQFINQCFVSGLPVRLIPFQPSSSLSYVLEFGDGYIRFYSNGAPIVETGTSISAINLGTGTITDTSHGYSNGQWILINGVVGTTQLNGNYYIVAGATTNTFTLTDLNGNAISMSGFTPYVSGGQAQRVYTITSPYAATDLFPDPLTGNPGIKFAQDVTSLIICHQNYPPQILTILSPTNWTLTTINFGATIPAPTGLSLSSTLTTSANQWGYAYTVTAVDINGQESVAATFVALQGASAVGSSTTSIQQSASTNTFSWSAVAGAQSYNVYKASPIYGSVTFPANTPVGFITNTQATTFEDSYPGIAPDFGQTPPIAQDPFLGSSILSYAVTTAGSYSSGTAIPTVTIGAPASGGTQATAVASLSVISSTINTAGIIGTTGNDPVGSYIFFPGNVTFKITSTSPSGGGNWNITGTVLTNPGTLTGPGTLPTNPVNATGASFKGFTSFFTVPKYNFTWGVSAVNSIQAGAGYTSAPTVTFSSGAAAATATLGPVGSNPGVPNFFQERLVLAAQKSAVQSVNMSQPASFFNFNISFPVEADDGISTQIVSSELNDIRSLTNVPTGLLALTGRAGWLINGGGGIATQDPITPANITAQAQAFNGANDIPPLKINMDVLYVTNKGNYVRDLAYNIYATIFTGSDISVLSNHLFFGTYLVQWAWSEEPFKTVWAIRNDGIALSLAYVKEQELIGWAHHDTQGKFQSVCTVVEVDAAGDTVDAAYFVIQRQLPNGNYVQYVERMANRYFPYGYEDSWCVDCALQTVPVLPVPGNLAASLGLLVVTGNASTVGNTVTLTDTVGAQFTSGMASGNFIVRSGGGIYKITGFTSSSIVTATVTRVPAFINSYTGTPTSQAYTVWQPVMTVGGLTQLIGQQVTGVADGAVVPPQTVSATGTITLSTAATKVTLGLSFLPQLQTLPLDLGEPTVQSKRKKVPAATMRVADTLGLQIGTTFANAVTVKDFQIGAIPTQSNGPALVTDLYSGDGRQILDQVWQEIGQLAVQQNLPYPATILGVMPEVVVGDTPSAKTP
jgi:hypothetical protein